MTETLSESDDLTAGTFDLIRRDVVAIADAMPDGKQKIFVAVVTAAGCIAGFDGAEKIRTEENVQGLFL